MHFKCIEFNYYYNYHMSIYQGDWGISEIQFEYKKVKFYDLLKLNGFMELIFQMIQKWGIERHQKFKQFTPYFDEF